MEPVTFTELTAAEQLLWEAFPHGSGSTWERPMSLPRLSGTR
jgi:hypothetical protein